MGTNTTRPQPDRKRRDFELGKTFVTRGVQQTVAEVEIVLALSRHHRGDWGEVGHEDRESNEDALRTGARLFSVYELTDDRKVWVITEAEDDSGRRYATTVLLPDEY